jgi:hypothetical protein
MKFKFCGNLDCPEWLVSEIIYLTKITNIKIRILSNNLINCILNTGKNYNDIKKTLEEMNFTEQESNIILSVLEFIIKNAAKFDCDDMILNKELQQLGLPQENADSISKVYKNHKENLKTKLKESIFKVSEMIGLEHKISFILASDNNNIKLSNPSNSNTGKYVEKDNLDNVENLEKDSIIPLTSKVDFILHNKENEKEEKFYFSTNKEVLEKLILDLEKVQGQINKYKTEQ